MNWRTVAAISAVVIAGVVAYRVTRLGESAAAAASQAAADVGAAIGGTIFDVLNPASGTQTFVSNEEIAWKRGMRTWLVSQGATDMEALTVIGAWRPGMPAPTMDNVIRLRNGNEPFSWWDRMQAQ